MWQWREVRSVLTALAAGPLKPGWSATGLGKPSAEVSAGVRLGWRWWPIYHPHHRGNQSQALVLATDLVVLWQMWATLSSKADALFQKVLQPSYRNVLQVWSGKVRGAQADSVPLVLRDFSEKDIHFPRPFDIQCGEYHRMVHGYHQRTGPFRVTWSALSVTEKIELLEDGDRRRKLQRVYQFHMANWEFLSEFFFHAGPGSTHALPLLEKVKMKFNVL